MECEDLATFNEQDEAHVFPNISLLSSLLENTSGRPLYDKTLMVEIFETWEETSKAKKGFEPSSTRKERFTCRGKFSILNGIKYA